MLDRRKLAVPLFAQAGAFVVVLVIGGFTGHAAPTPHPGIPGNAGHRNSCQSSSTASPSGAGSPAADKDPR